MHRLGNNWSYSFFWLQLCLLSFFFSWSCTITVVGLIPLFSNTTLPLYNFLSIAHNNDELFPTVFFCGGLFACSLVWPLLNFKWYPHPVVWLFIPNKKVYLCTCNLTVATILVSVASEANSSLEIYWQHDIKWQISGTHWSAALWTWDLWIHLMPTQSWCFVCVLVKIDNSVSNGDQTAHRAQWQAGDTAWDRHEDWTA